MDATYINVSVSAPDLVNDLAWPSLAHLPTFVAEISCGDRLVDPLLLLKSLTGEPLLVLCALQGSQSRQVSKITMKAIKTSKTDTKLSGSLVPSGGDGAS